MRSFGRRDRQILRQFYHVLDRFLHILLFLFNSLYNLFINWVFGEILGCPRLVLCVCAWVAAVGFKCDCQ
jgi:hypothetical protein